MTEIALSAEQIAEGWLPHAGGPCPVDPESRPMLKFADGWTWEPQKDRKWLARYANWSVVVAYRPLSTFCREGV